MRIISWNVNRAHGKKEVWDFLLYRQPDVALLQEVDDIPGYVTSEYLSLMKKAVCRNGQHLFHTAVLAKGRIVPEYLLSDSESVNRLLELFRGNYVSCAIQLSCGGELHVVSVHSPYWRLANDVQAGIDVAEVRTAHPDLIGMAILWYALKSTVVTGNWIVGGDFNCSETYDPGWPGRNGKNWLRIPGSAQMLQRTRALGFTDCLRKTEQDPLIPTFRHTSGKVDHQIDHLFVSNCLLPSLEKCEVGDRATIFGRLSDHLPIIAEFTDGEATSHDSIPATQAAAVFWKSAVTYPDAPHEYVLRERYPETYALYQQRIAQEGREEQFMLRGHTATYRYCYADDGYKYWIIGNVLNRVLPKTKLEAISFEVAQLAR